MKKLIVTLSVALVGLTTAFSQGIFSGVNVNTANNVLGYVYDTDGVTKVQGTAYALDYYYGPAGADPSTFTSLGYAINFRTGAAAGVVATTVVPSIPAPAAAGSVYQVQLRAWRVADGATWSAVASGSGVASSIDPTINPVINVTLASPTGTAPFMTGLTSQHLITYPVPEPATVLLGLAGIGGLVFLRRKMAK